MQTNEVIELPSKLMTELCAVAVAMGAKYRNSSGYAAGNVEPVYIDGYGLLSQAAMPFYPGLLGEAALYHYMKSKGLDFPTPDVEIKTSDAGYDFLFNNCRIQIKTSTRLEAPCLIKVGKLNWDVVVSATHVLGTNKVILKGWREALFVECLYPFKGKGDWYNYRVNDYTLKSMGLLVEMLNGTF